MSRERIWQAAQALVHRWPPVDGCAELFIKYGEYHRRELKTGAPPGLEQGRELGAASRVVLPDGRCGLVASAAPTPDSLSGDLDKAHHLARIASPVPGFSLPGAAAGQRTWSSALPPTAESATIGTGGASMLRELMRRGNSALTVRGAWMRRGTVVTSLVNSAGFSGRYRMEVTTLGIMLHGAGRDLLAHEESRSGDPPLPAALFRRACSRARHLSGTPSPAPGPFTSLVLSPEAAAPLLLAAAARFVSAGGGATRQHAPRPGTRVASPAVTLEDLGRCPGSLQDGPFDGEGTPCGRTVLVRDGRFENAVHDRWSAAAAGVASSGNAIRDSYRQWPRPGLNTLAFRARPGLDEEDLACDISRGLYVVLAGPPDEDRISAGIFDGVLYGRWIIDGLLGPPARPIRFQHPLEDLLHRVSAAAGRPRLVHLDGPVLSPAIRLDGISACR